FTNERVIMREGVFSREGRDIPLNRVNDVSFHHTFFQRLLGTGVLTIESAGERGQVVLENIPHVEKIQSQLYELVEADHEALAVGEVLEEVVDAGVRHDDDLAGGAVQVRVADQCPGAQAGAVDNHRSAPADLVQRPERTDLHGGTGRRQPPFQIGQITAHVRE